MNVTNEIKYSDEYDGSLRNLYRCECICGNERWLPLNKTKEQIYCYRTCSAKPNTSVIVICAQCGNDIIRTPGHLKYSKSKLYFCNRKCASLAQRIDGIPAVIPSHYGKQRNRYINCFGCNKLLIKTLNKYCSSNCKYESFIKKWLNKEVTGNNNGFSKDPSDYIKRYLIGLYGEQCQMCGWNERHTVTNKIPIQMDHIDGNSENNSIENLRLLCPNHHSLTLTYGSLNIGNGRKHRRKNKVL